METWPEGSTLNGLFITRAREVPEKVAIESTRGRLTFRELKFWIDRRALPDFVSATRKDFHIVA